MMYFFLGSEINIIKEKINLLINELNISNVIKYDYSDTNISEIIDEVNYVDLFNERKLIVVNDFSFKKIKDNDEKKFIRYINNQNDNVIIFKVSDEALDERKNLTKLIKEKCKVIISEKLDYKMLGDYITNMFKEANKKITFNQIRKILDYCEYNTDITINEVNKLLLYKMDDNVITDSDIDLVISKSYEKELFTLNDMVLSRNIGSCFDSYKILIRSNIDEMIIIENLAKQFRLLYQTKLLLGSMDEYNISKTLKVKSFVIKKLIPYVRSYKEDEIIDILYRLSEVDSDIKIKGYDKYKVMEAFFMSL